MFDCCTWHRGLFSVQKKYIQFSTFTLFLHFPPKKIKDSTGGVFLDILIRSLAWIFAASTWDSPWAIIDRKLDVLLLGSLFSFLRIEDSLSLPRRGQSPSSRYWPHTGEYHSLKFKPFVHPPWNVWLTFQYTGRRHSVKWGEKSSVSAPLLSKSKSKTSSCPSCPHLRVSPSFPFSFSI